MALVNGISNISAKELKIQESNKEFAINAAKPFICSITNIEQNIVVYLLDKRGVALTGGSISILDEFVSLELTDINSKHIFESQQLK